MHLHEELTAHHFPESPWPERDRPLAAEARTDVLERTAGSFSVRRLTSKEDRQTAAVLDVQGEVDLATAPILLDVALPVLGRGTGPVVVDLSHVPFMDSAGVHVLVAMLRRLKPQNRQLTISYREHGQVHRLLALLGLLDAVLGPRGATARATSSRLAAGTV